MGLTRRSFVERALGGAVLTLSFSVGGSRVLLTPAEARAKAVPILNFSKEQMRDLEVLADAIVPGSAALGIGHFLDHQVRADPNDALLIAKYFQVPPPYIDFYTRGLAGTAAIARTTYGKGLADLDSNQLTELISQLVVSKVMHEGTPLALFYICLRSDAVDVVFGTPQGFERLNVPYMEHIMPPEKWDG